MSASELHAHRVLQVAQLQTALAVARSALLYVYEEGLTADSTLEDLQKARSVATEALQASELPDDGTTLADRLEAALNLIDRPEVVADSSTPNLARWPGPARRREFAEWLSDKVSS